MRKISLFWHRPITFYSNTLCLLEMPMELECDRRIGSPFQIQHDLFRSSLIGCSAGCRVFGQEGDSFLAGDPHAAPIVIQPGTLVLMKLLAQNNTLLEQALGHLQDRPSIFLFLLAQDQDRGEGLWT